VTKLNESVGYVCGIKPEVFGAELFAPTPVTDGSGDKDSTAAHGIKEMGVIIWIHDDVWLLDGLLFQVEMKTPAAIT
jgi:hypothetical protein